MRCRHVRLVASGGVAASLALGLAACGSGGGPAASASSAPGVASSSITIGVVSTLTGPESYFSNAEKGFAAAIDYQNAHGGIYGRKIVLDVEDDGGSASQDLSAVHSLIQAKGAFMIASLDGGVSGSASLQYLQQNNIPEVGSGTFTTGAQYGNVFQDTGDYNASLTSTSSDLGLVLKSLGAKKVGSLGTATSPTSIAAAENSVRSAQEAGLVAGYENTTVPETNTDWTPYVLGFKKTDTDGFISPLTEPLVVGFLTTAKEQGLTNLKTLILPGFQHLYVTKPAVSLDQGAYVLAVEQPSELNTAATKQMNAVLKRYGGFTYQADWFAEHGYVTGLLAIEGLKVAGKNPTRASFISKLRKVSGWTADGLQPKPVDFSSYNSTLPLLGNDNCVWVLKITGSSFVPLDRAPICGSSTVTAKP